MLHRFHKVLSAIAAFFVLAGISVWRAQPAFVRDYCGVESGSWLIEQWTKGFWRCLTGIREDYLTATNQCVIGIANALSTMQVGHPLSLQGPKVQHWVCALYVACVFFGIWSVLRRRYRALPALALVVLMLLMPDSDRHHGIFGEASNIGFFSALAVVFVYYDLLLREGATLRRIVFGAAVVVLCIFTSPLAALTSGGLGLVLLVREWFARAGDRSGALWLCVLHGLITAVSIGVVWHGLTHNPYVALEHESADDTLAKRFVELTFGRQIAYPLLFAVYRQCNDAIALGASAVIFCFVGVVAWLGWRRGRGEREAMHWWSAPALLLLACAMAVAVLVARKSALVEFGGVYSAVQSRYFLMQHMIVVASVGITLLHLAKLFPRCGTGVAITLALWLACYASVQQERLQDYIVSRTPADVARGWRHGLTRAMGLQVITGDWQEAASRARDEGLSLATIDGVRGFRMQVPFELLHGVWPDGRVPSRYPDQAIGAMDASSLKLSDKAWRDGMTVRDAIICPRAHGLLLLFDVEANDVRISSDNRRLWIAGLPTQAVLRAYATSLPASQETSRRENWCFRVQAFLPGTMHADSLMAMIPTLTVAIGSKPGAALAVAPIAPARGTIGWASLQADDSFALRLHPLGEARTWSWNAADVSVRNATVDGDRIIVPAVTDLPFEEQAYLELNRDIASAKQAGALGDVRAHYAAFAKWEKRETARRSITVNVGPMRLRAEAIDGIEVEVAPSEREQTPNQLALVFHGVNGERSSLMLAPADLTQRYRVEFRSYFLRDHLHWPSFEIRDVEISVSGMADGGTLQLTALKFFGPSP